MINGSFLRDGGSCRRYRKLICGRDSKEGTGLEPATDIQLSDMKTEVERDGPSYPMRKVSKCNLAKLSA